MDLAKSSLRWREGASLSIDHRFRNAALLTNRAVLVAGSDGAPPCEAELSDPPKTWTKLESETINGGRVSALGQKRLGHRSVRRPVRAIYPTADTSHA